MRSTITILILGFILVFSASLLAQEKNTHKIMISGSAQTSLISESDASTVETAFEPVFLFKLNDNFLFESEIEAEIEDGAQNFNLEYTQLLYFVTDFLTIGAGRMLNPTNYYSLAIHPDWISKFADTPFFNHEETTIQAPSVIGFQARGAFAIGPTRLNYAAYYSNGAVLDTASGRLNYDNFADNNKDKGIGARLGFLPVPSLEVGAAFESAKVGDDGSPYESVKAMTTTFDYNFKKQFENMKTTVTSHGQFITRKIDNPNVTPLTYDNKASGGYVEVAVRPDGMENKYLQNVEVAGRYDWFTPPKMDPDNTKLMRSSFGLNYWISPISVIKVDYESEKDQIPGGSSSTSNVTILQFATGL